MQLSGQGALSVGLDARMSASSVGIMAARVATAAARYRDQGVINERDRRALKVFMTNLSSEARIFRGESVPGMDDETSYAFAGVTLAVFERGAIRSIPEAEAAKEFDDLVAKLALIESGARVSSHALDEVEKFFLTASGIASEEDDSVRHIDAFDDPELTKR